MAMMDPANWTGPEQNMPPAAEDDFQFLEMGGMPNLGDGLSFDFHQFNPANEGQMMHGLANHRGESMDTPMSGTEAPPMASRSNVSVPSQMPPITSAAGMPPVTSQVMPPHTPTDAISEIDAQIHFLQHQRMQQQHRQMEEQQRHFEERQAAFYAQQQRNMVPPTPQSLEIQAANQYFQQRGSHGANGDQPGQHAQAMYDRYQRIKQQEDMAFTPLVSPAVTPLDGQFPVETQYTVPGAYFSPLTSPALHAQNESSLPNFEHRHAGSTTTNSPVEMELEPNAQSAGGADLKKARKAVVNKARKSNVRQSPISKPQRKKTASTPIMNAQILTELAESAAEHSQAEKPIIKAAPSSIGSNEESENASVSPETLSEMPPPPVPQVRSARQSPYIGPQNQSTPQGPSAALPTLMNGKPSPATPATLFKISPQSKSADAGHDGQLASEHIENFELPESASFPKPKLPQINTQHARVMPHSPLLDTSKSSVGPPLQSPATARPPSRMASASESPQIGPKSAIPNPRKTPLMAPRGPKKRSSGSVHVSPALRPKISPSIKPLLPGTPGMSAEDSASRLLATKSNYQNILEGNTVPGVSYPSELSTNLTSKRTSHKIAEQGRRNRINSALQEIATLLPKNVAKDIKEDEPDSPGGDKSDKRDGKGAGSTPNSKASTVEMAIVYIKQLKQELDDANKRAEDAERKLAAA